MKNILRKLHIGGNHEDEVDAGRIIEGNRSSHEGSGGILAGVGVSGSAHSVSSGSSTTLSTSPATAESNNKVITLLNAFKGSVGRVPQNAIAQVRHRLDTGGHNDTDSSTTVGRRNLTPPGSFKRGSVSPPDTLKRGSLLSSDNQTDGQQLETLHSSEEYELRMAINLSNQDLSHARVLELEQIETAKRISLGLSATAIISESDSISNRYWAFNTLEFYESVPNGFYDVFGLSSESDFSERMPSLVELQKMPLSETSKIEVVLVDRRLDGDLLSLEAQAIDVAGKSDLEDVGLLRTFLAQKIALLVAEHMGGPVGSEMDLLTRWERASWNAKSTTQNIVLKLGSLNVGLSRHRALLFKVLADCVGVPCQLVKGRHYPGVAEEGAVNFIKVDDHREYIVDLMGAPGALIRSDRTVSDDASMTDASPKSMKTEQSFMSSTQSSPSSSMRSVRSETADHKGRKDATVQKGASVKTSPSSSTRSTQLEAADIKEKYFIAQKGTSNTTDQIVTNIALDGRHHSEPTELQEYDAKHAWLKAPTRPAHIRSPSWTEGIGLPDGRQMTIGSVIDAAKENPHLAEKLQKVLLESGVMAEVSQMQLQVQVEDKKLVEEKIIAQDRRLSVPVQQPPKKGTVKSGRPPSGSLKSMKPLLEDLVSSNDGLPSGLQRLNSVEGLGDRRPLETPHAETPRTDLLPFAAAVPVMPVPAGVSVADALPVASVPVGLTVAIPGAAPVELTLAIPVPLPAAAPPTPVRIVEDKRGISEQILVGNLPVKVAATVAATAAVVAKSMASSMVAAAARGDGSGAEVKFDNPIASLATSAAVGRRPDSSETLPIMLDQVEDEKFEMYNESARKGSVAEEGRDGRERHFDGKRSETGANLIKSSQGPVTFSGDGLDGEVSAEEERNSENLNQVVQKRYDSVLADVAEWEIPWNDIVIGDRIGIGSYGEVYRGDWHGSEVAVKKFLDQDLSGYALEEFRSEVRIMRRLRHPNVVLFMGAITRAPNLSIVTEFLPRGSLYRLIHRPNNQLDERRRLRMALDVAKGMNYLHSGNPVIVHRDLKSPNLLVDKNWVVKVCDFGLSRMKHSTFLSSKSTAGTPEWMAPEMLRNEPSNEKCDVYSFGVILWELATLQQPWNGMNPMQVVGAVGFQHRRLEIPSEIDAGLAKIIRECWHDNPRLRPSFSQLMAALRPLQRPMSAAAAYSAEAGQRQTSQG